MKPPIAGVYSPELHETTAMVVWPSIGSLSAGRVVGRMSGISAGVGPFRLGRLGAAVSIPLALIAFAWLFIPFLARRYRLTSRRVVIQRGLAPIDGPAIGLDEFDAIHIETLPGQEWLRCGEVVFSRGGREVFRLSGVSRPEVFRGVCTEARAALLSVREVLQQQSRAAAPQAST